MTLALGLLFVALFAFAGGCALGRSLRKVPPRPEPDQKALLALHAIATQLSHDVHDHEDRVRTIAGSLGAASRQDADVAECVRQIVEASDSMRRKLRDAEERIREQAREMHVQALAAKTDSLTLLRNRGALDAYLSERLATKRERGDATSLLLLDLDHFKRLNDAHGHVVGDEALKAAAKAMVDAAPSDAFIARYGGEEFAVAFPGRTAAESREAAEAIRANIGAGALRVGSTDVRVTASAGLAEAHLADDLADWIRRVDEVLYDAKSRGRNRGIWRCADSRLPFLAKASGATEAAAPHADEAGFDPVTGLSTRGSFMEDLKRRHAQFRRVPGQASLALVRIDEYDSLLSKRGFRAAEQALLATSQCLRATMRETDHVARFGRDMFALFLPEAALGDAQRIVERIREAIEGPLVLKDGTRLDLAISCATVEVDSAEEIEAIVARCREELDRESVEA